MGRNSDTVRAALDAWTRRDMEALARYVTPEFEWIEFEESALHAGDARVGEDAVAEITAELEESFGTYSAEIVELVEAGDDTVVAILREAGRGAASGAPVSTEFGYLITLSDGKAARIEVFRTAEQAFAAVKRPGRDQPA